MEEGAERAVEEREREVVKQTSKECLVRTWPVRRRVPRVPVLQFRRHVPLPLTDWKGRGRGGGTDEARADDGRTVGRSGGRLRGLRMESRQSRLVCALANRPHLNMRTLELTDPGHPWLSGGRL